MFGERLEFTSIQMPHPILDLWIPRDLSPKFRFMNPFGPCHTSILLIMAVFPLWSAPSWSSPISSAWFMRTASTQRRRFSLSSLNRRRCLKIFGNVKTVDTHKNRNLISPVSSTMGEMLVCNPFRRLERAVLKTASHFIFSSTQVKLKESNCPKVSREGLTLKKHGCSSYRLAEQNLLDISLGADSFSEARPRTLIFLFIT